METLLIIVVCLVVAACAEWWVAQGRCQRGRVPEDIQ